MEPIDGCPVNDSFVQMDSPELLKRRNNPKTNGQTGRARTKGCKLQGALSRGGRGKRVAAMVDKCGGSKGRSAFDQLGTR